MPKRLAPLLPAEIGSDRFPLDTRREDPSKRKRVGTDVACNPCRRRKTRCDGKRPICAACRKRSTECTFVEKKESPRLGQSSGGSHEVLELLKSAPEQQAFEILRLLRTNGDPDSVLNIIKRGQHGIKRLPNNDTACAIRSMQSPLEFELMARNPATLRQALLTTLERDELLGARKLRRSNVPLHANDGFRVDVPPEGILDESRQSDPLLCDESFEDLRINCWTDTLMFHDYAARAIRFYPTTDNPFLSVFDPCLFISGLVGQCRAQSSLLLVNALMYWAYQMHTAINKRAVQFSENIISRGGEAVAPEWDNATNGHKHVLFGIAPSQARKGIEWVQTQTQLADSYTASGIFN
ncbi:uncharacterized protein GLRG_07546 [Colletotrichum graminicola M1.001]|uniref:Zn(2)-C6 fungal-type domain-containing protein n=1 Tax=Colletotrichum graminicola (strain M1.001 / M2 / FGSC 10212) TaxID=645133 RepID=E3QNU4_COLGM|nr:uncharacterized protein GLRG_07546 [Colletotrichum graminicola M1.001]EFQ32532.1 hypothetical protein GLRG_07546 [Colletotrichum graminicola M1.001]